jgi:hypothetical protein
VARRPTLLLPILVYILLDFSLPGMPGAFVFESAESVETIRANRADVDMVIARPLVTRPSMPPLLRVEERDAFAPRPPVTPVVRPVIARLPRATLRPAPPTEDPH